jgi:outer membrane protein assembly factor BamD (BamD/ComL family)
VSTRLTLKLTLVLLAGGWLTGCAGQKPQLRDSAPPVPPPKEEQAAKDKEQKDSGIDLVGGIKALWNGDVFLPKAPEGPADSLVLRGDGLEEDRQTASAPSSPELAGAHELYRRGEYAKAQRLFHAIADNTKNPVHVAEEARYFEAECLRQQGYYPKAADTYAKTLNDFPSGAYREQAVQRMYDIADFWLDDTRQEIRETEEKRDGKRWFVNQHFFNWDKAKPLLDEQGRAVEKLEQVRYNDMLGPYADKSLFLMGKVKFFNTDYREADHYFSQLVEMHPNSELAPAAVELAIISKHLSTGGADYDGRKVAEARQLVHKALENYPQLAANKADFLERQLIGITLQQAEKDYKVAEFYRRQGHPESAYFYYEIVRRRYPGTKYFDLATDRMHELRAVVEKGAGKASAEPRDSLPPRQKLRVGERPAELETAPAPRPVTPPAEIAPAPRPFPGG